MQFRWHFFCLLFILRHSCILLLKFTNLNHLSKYVRNCMFIFTFLSNFLWVFGHTVIRYQVFQDDINNLHHNSNLSLWWGLVSYPVHSFFRIGLPLLHSPVSWSCRIHRRHHYRWIRLTNQCHGYKTKQFDGKAPVMLELWGMWSTLSLPELPGQLWPGEVVADRIVFMG